MYLIEIDEETGLISDDVTNSGWKSIKSFNTLLKKKGIKAMTVVAMTVDYLSPLSHYKEKDRFERACSEIYDKRDSLVISDDLIADAIKSYKELQMNPDLETERINREIKIRLIEKMNEANSNEDDSAIEKYRKLLSDHEQTIKNFNDRFNKKEAVSKAVTANGYELSRIEAEIRSRKKSKFVNHGEDFENPNRLGL